MNEGLITKIITWSTHPYYGGETTLQWAMGLLLILILSFLWSTTVKQIE